VPSPAAAPRAPSPLHNRHSLTRRVPRPSQSHKQRKRHVEHAPALAPPPPTRSGTPNAQRNTPPPGRRAAPATPGGARSTTRPHPSQAPSAGTRQHATLARTTYHDGDAGRDDSCVREGDGRARGAAGDAARAGARGRDGMRAGRHGASRRQRRPRGDRSHRSAGGVGGARRRRWPIWPLAV